MQSSEQLERLVFLITSSHGNFYINFHTKKHALAFMRDDNNKTKKKQNGFPEGYTYTRENQKMMLAKILFGTFQIPYPYQGLQGRRVKHFFFKHVGADTLNICTTLTSRPPGH